MLSLARGIAIVLRQTWNAPHFANVTGPAINMRRELRYVDSYIGMLNATEKDRQCSHHREIEYICLPPERNGDITTFSVTTDTVSDICLSWINACLIMWRPS